MNGLMMPSDYQSQGMGDQQIQMQQRQQQQQQMVEEQRRQQEALAEAATAQIVGLEEDYGTEKAIPEEEEEESSFSSLMSMNKKSITPEAALQNIPSSAVSIPYVQPLQNYSQGLMQTGSRVPDIDRPWLQGA